MPDENALVELARQQGILEGRVAGLETQMTALQNDTRSGFTQMQGQISDTRRELLAALDKQTADLKPIVVQHEAKQAIAEHKEQRLTRWFDTVGSWSSIAIVIGTLMTGFGLYQTWQANQLALQSLHHAGLIAPDHSN